MPWIMLALLMFVLLGFIVTVVIANETITEHNINERNDAERTAYYGGTVAPIYNHPLRWGAHALCGCWIGPCATEQDAYLALAGHRRVCPLPVPRLKVYDCCDLYEWSKPCSSPSPY